MNPAGGAVFDTAPVVRCVEARSKQSPLLYAARGVYKVTLSAQSQEEVAVKYYLHVETSAGTSMIFPSTAPGINHTVVVAGNAAEARKVQEVHSPLIPDI